MNIEIFPSVKKAKDGTLCTSELFNTIADDIKTRNIIQAIRELLPHVGQAGVGDQIAALKKELPIITWQASFSDHHRSDRSAIPSGLYMIDVDGVDREQLEKIKKWSSMRNIPPKVPTKSDFICILCTHKLCIFSFQIQKYE